MVNKRRQKYSSGNRKKDERRGREGNANEWSRSAGLQVADGGEGEEKRREQRGVRRSEPASESSARRRGRRVAESPSRAALRSCKQMAILPEFINALLASYYYYLLLSSFLLLRNQIQISTHIVLSKLNSPMFKSIFRIFLEFNSKLLKSPLVTQNRELAS